jgi:hypothetical protein
VIFVTVGSAAASEKEDAISVVHRWIDGFNKGDAKAAVSTCAEQVSIIDDFPPHEWHGLEACKQWFEDFESMSKAQRITNSRIALEPASAAVLHLRRACAEQRPICDPTQIRYVPCLSYTRVLAVTLLDGSRS